MQTDGGNSERLTKAEAQAQGRKALSTGGNSERLTKAEAKAQGRKALYTGRQGPVHRAIMQGQQLADGTAAQSDGGLGHHITPWLS
eukprot:COSAG01_NODE_54488_length_331_cov_5.943966_1_plen_85_part_01